MKIKTQELTGIALDWAVEGATTSGPTGERRYERDKEGLLYDPLNEYTVSPSTYWAQGGPIIECENIHLNKAGKVWWATYDEYDNVVWNKPSGKGDTPLIAAMRCYVASKLGDEVDVPNEMLK